MKTDTKCIFCKIVAGQEPVSKVYEDGNILCFMNNRPVHEGECLIIPKEHVDHFMDVDDELAAQILLTGQKLSRKIREIVQPQRVGYVVAGYGVPRAHLIVIPQYHSHDITSQHFANPKEGLIEFTDQHIPLAARKDLDDLATKLRIT